jgi:cytochrome d ubiquinol oxidase subunit II
VLLIDVWAILVGLAMVLYVVLDGISLGVAMLFGMFVSGKERSVLINTIAPVWDANQTWLLFGGGAIFAAFPVVYAVLSSGLYVPLITFIAGLIFRGVAFEFRSESIRKRAWEWAFFLGSLVAVLSQGMTLGGVLTGVVVRGREFAGGPLDWLNPFSVMVGIALIPGYVMLASAYLVVKTAGSIQDRAYAMARKSTLLVLAVMAIVTIWMPFHYPLILTHWTGAPRAYFVWTFPILGLLAAWGLVKSVRKRRTFAPLVCAIVLFLSGYLGLLASLYPYAIPPSVKIHEAAAQPESLLFTLWGALIVLPLVLAYTGYSYWVFRGKTGEEGEGYS